MRLIRFLQLRCRINHPSYLTSSAPKVRWFSVKELPWCSSSPSSIESSQSSSTSTSTRSKKDEWSLSPIGVESKPACMTCVSPNSLRTNEGVNEIRLGIIAAMDETRVIGWKPKHDHQQPQKIALEEQQRGQTTTRKQIHCERSTHESYSLRGIPWNIPNDRIYFQDQTRNQILIIGRNTFLERPDLSHIQHVDQCIVLSTTISSLDGLFSLDTLEGRESTIRAHVPTFIQEGRLNLASSLKNALDMALDFLIQRNEKNLTVSHLNSSHSTDLSVQNENTPNCWIGGGQRLYEEAIRHPSTTEIHLTTVHSQTNQEKLSNAVFFPAKYRWDNRFRHCDTIADYSTHRVPSQTEASHENYLRYTIQVYKRYERTSDR